MLKSFRSRSASPKLSKPTTPVEENPDPIDQTVYDLFREDHERPSALWDDSFDPILQSLDPDVQCTLNDPLGRIILTLSCYLKKAAAKTGTASLNLNEICTSFKNHTEKHKDSLQANVASHAALIKQQVLSSSKPHIQYDSSFPIQPPSSFSPINTLTSSDKEKLALSRFPTAPSLRFTGANDRQNLIETLYLINAAQKQSNLSEAEFRIIFFKCFSGPAFEILRRCDQEGYSIPDFYSLLINLYQPLISPHLAETILSQYKAPKHLTLELVIQDIEMLANRAVSIYKHNRISAEPNTDIENMNRHIYNTKVIQCLIHSLPQFSRTKALIAYEHLLHRREGMVPSINDLRLELHPYKTSINEDIATHGLNKSAYDTIMQQKENAQHVSSPKPSSNGYLFNIPLHKRPSRPNHFQKNRPVHRVHVNAIASERPRPPSSNTRTLRAKPPSNNLNIRGTLKCSLCGRTGHSSNQFCYSMRDNSGKLAHVLPTSLPCTICKEKFSQSLFHPPAFCFRRPRYLELKAANKIPYVTAKDVEDIYKRK